MTIDNIEGDGQRFFLVGNLYRVRADDAEHAVEQYHYLMTNLDIAEANYVREDV